MKTAKTIQIMDKLNNNISPAVCLESLYYEKKEKTTAGEIRQNRYAVFDKLPIYENTEEINYSSNITTLYEPSLYYSDGGDVSILKIKFIKKNLKSSLSYFTDISLLCSSINEQYNILNSSIQNLINNDNNIDSSIFSIKYHIEHILPELENKIDKGRLYSLTITNNGTSIIYNPEQADTSITITGGNNTSVSAISSLSVVPSTYIQVQNTTGDIIINCDNLSSKLNNIDSSILNINNKLTFSNNGLIYYNTSDNSYSALSESEFKNLYNISGKIKIQQSDEQLWLTGYPTEGASSTETLYYNQKAYITTDGYYFSSDESLKKNITNISHDFISSIFESEPLIHDFVWKENNKKSSGFIAQEIMNYIPEAVKFNEGTKLLSVNYDVALSKLVGALIEKVKEQQDQINYLNKKLIFKGIF